MTNSAIEVITSVQRRRRWPRVEKERIVAASLVPGAVASEVARAAGIHTSQLFRWRRQLCSRTAGDVGFAAVAVVADTSAAGPGAGVIEIEVAGARVRITGAADQATVTGVIIALTRGPGRS